MSDIDKQVSAILASGGFTPMPQGEMRGLFCKETGGGWWMGGVHATGVYSKHTRISDATTDDPILAAQELVAHVNGRPTAEEIAKAHSDASDLAAYKGEGPFDPQPEASETPQDETHGETGEEAQADSSGEDFGPATNDDPQPGSELGDLPEDRDASAGGEVADELPIEAELGSDAAGSADSPDGQSVFEPAPEEPIDADYTLPEIELIEPDPNPDFGADVLAMQLDMDAAIEPTRDDDQAARDAAFIFGDNLHQMRTAAIGLVMQHALALMPEPTDYARLSELRNFTLGVSEGRWPDDPALREELDVREARERRRHELAASRDEKVGFLMTADREAIEAFDPAAGWPQ